MRKIILSLICLTLLAGCGSGSGGVLSGAPPTYTSGTQGANLLLRSGLLASGRSIRVNQNTVALVPDRGLNSVIAPAYRAEVLAWSRSHPLKGLHPFRARGAQYLWASDSRGAIWETKAGSSTDKTGKKIAGALLDCPNPAGLKVDHQGDLWAACGNPALQTTVGTVNMYAPGATTATITLNTSYTSGSTTTTSTPVDVAFDAAGDVYVSNVIVLSAAGSISRAAIGGIQVFPADCGSHPCTGDTPSAVIKDPTQNPRCPKKFELCVVQSGGTFIDLDKAGAMYEDYTTTFYECTFSSCTEVFSQTGVDKIRELSRQRPRFTNVVSGMIYPGGVYATANGSTLNVLDQGTNTVTQYALSPFGTIGTLGPMPATPCGQAFIAFNRDEKQLASGDYGCNAIDVGSVAANTFVQNTNQFYGAISGVAYAPSDK